MERTQNRHLRILVAGLLALLPLVLTAALVFWVGQLVYQWIGPGSVFGSLLSGLGFALVADRDVAYLLGALTVLVGVYLLGVLVTSRLGSAWDWIFDHTVGRVPLIRRIYETSERFVGMFERREQTDFGAMRPVWCFFGGEGGVAVLALTPNPEPIVLAGQRYRAVLVPTAPVPIGGGLLYVPADWVKPAGFGMETLTSVYVSMGISAPPEAPRPAAIP
jgi:uncharacterized membrane protein